MSNKTIILLSLFLLCCGTLFKASAQAPDFSGYRFFINPGHGGNDSDDRHMIETDFWESAGNLEKGLYLRELMTKLNATVFMSRTTNYTADDLPLSSIVSMANSSNADFFLAIHSNGFDGTQNQPLMLFRGYDDQPLFPEAKVIAGLIWDKIFEKGNCWTSSSKWIKGDLTFYPQWGTQGLGVLRGLNIPGVLSEGSFHDYVPEGWRLRNSDFLHHESWAFVRALAQHENVAPPSHGIIAGIVRDTLKQPGWYFKPGTRDQRLPMNGIEVTLLPGNKKYTTDNLNNGFFMFDSIAPGNYKLLIKDVENMMDDSLELSVSANKSTLADMWLRFDTTTIPEIASVNPVIEDSVIFNQEFVITFNMPMNRDSVQKAIEFSPGLQLTYTWDALNTVLRIKPLIQYQRQTNYTFSITSTACSEWKVPVQAPFSTTFVTKNRTKLRLEKHFPEEGSTDISYWPQIRLVFDAPLNESQLGEMILFRDDADHDVARIRATYKEKEGKGHYYFEPAVMLVKNKTYRLLISKDLADIGGNKTGSDIEITFTTRSDPYPPGTIIESFDNITVFWDPEASGSTVGTNNPLTTFTYSTIIRRSGITSGMLDYVFVNPSGGVCRTFDTRKPVIHHGDTKTFGMWVFGDLSYNILEYWFYLDGSTNHIVYADTIDWAGWELKTIPLTAIPGNADFNFHSIVVRQSDNGELSGTIWFDEASVYTLTGIEEKAGNEDTGDLFIFPNPVTEGALMQVTLEYESEIKLDITGITGQTERVVAEGTYLPGKYDFNWNPDPALSSGIYF
ncbi:MAG TPA: Ig-like domain-containing protein, partial [Bacteroidales bacterium]|nr:Ig-like domain-containing protein [Bacteroidales bacterium]